MKIVSRLIAAILFIFFFFFALKNTQEVTLHFFLGYERTDPLVLILLVTFVGGAILGVLAMTPIVVPAPARSIAPKESDECIAQGAGKRATGTDSAAATRQRRHSTAFTLTATYGI